jgi:hypothetical protein
MDNYDVKRFGMLLEQQVKVEGMKAANLVRQLNGFTDLVYYQSDFDEVANRISDITYAHNEQL